MVSASLRAISLGGATALLIAEGPEYITLAGVLVTSVAGLVAQVLKYWSDAKREEQRHRFEMEDRAATAAVRRSIDTRLAANLDAVNENTALTREVADKAEKAYEAGNHINEKIAAITAAALNQKGGESAKP